MKNFILLFTLSILSSTAFAQLIPISEAPRSLQSEMENSFSFEIMDMTSDEAKDAWEKFMKNYRTKTKYDRKKKVYVSTGVQIPNLSSDELDVYANIIGDKKKAGVSMVIWFDMGDGYLSSDSDEDIGREAQNLLSEFALGASKHHAQTIVEAQEKELTKMEKELAKLIKDNRDYHKNIEKAKDEIVKNEKNIIINEQDQKKAESAIQAQKKEVQKAKDYVKKYANN